jgi:hypothetical protein
MKSVYYILITCNSTKGKTAIFIFQVPENILTSTLKNIKIQYSLGIKPCIDESLKEAQRTTRILNVTVHKYVFEHWGRIPTFEPVVICSESHVN